MSLTPDMFEPPLVFTGLRSLEISRNWQLKGSIRAIAKSLPKLVHFQGKLSLNPMLHMRCSQSAFFCLVLLCCIVILLFAAIGLGDVDVKPGEVLKHVFTDESPFRGAYVGHDSCQKVEIVRLFAWDGDHGNGEDGLDNGDQPHNGAGLQALLGNLLYG